MKGIPYFEMFYEAYCIYSGLKNKVDKNIFDNKDCLDQVVPVSRNSRWTGVAIFGFSEKKHHQYI